MIKWTIVSSIRSNLTLLTCYCVLSALPSITVFDKNNLRVQFAIERDQTDPLSLNITLTATNGSAVAINDFVFQAAVPKVKLAGFGFLTECICD